jgi:hypothetical protein
MAHVRITSDVDMIVIVIAMWPEAFDVITADDS